MRLAGNLAAPVVKLPLRHPSLRASVSVRKQQALDDREVTGKAAYEGEAASGPALSWSRLVDNRHVRVLGDFPWLSRFDLAIFRGFPQVFQQF